MQDRLGNITQIMRERILAAHGITAGDRMREQSLAEDLDVSRTLVRLALAELEKEGLVERLPNRGFVVRTFTLDDVMDAIAVRGEMEAMAARLCAEQSVYGETLSELRQLNSRMSALLQGGLDKSENRLSWVRLNQAFHEIITEKSGNRFVKESVERLSRLPLVGAGAIVFDQSGKSDDALRLANALRDHEALVDAIANRQGQRAWSIMKEHTIASAKNKYDSFDAMQSASDPALKGLRLVKN